MNEYIIFTDSACDLSTDVLRSWGVKFCSLTFSFDGEEDGKQQLVNLFHHRFIPPAPWPCALRPPAPSPWGSQSSAA